MKRKLFMSLLVSLCACPGPRPEGLDGGQAPSTSLDGGPADGGVETGVDGGDTASLLALIAPRVADVGVDLVRCVTLKALDLAGHEVTMAVDDPRLSIEVTPSQVAIQGDVDDCPQGGLPIQGLAQGSAVVQVSAVLSGQERSVETSFQVVAASGQLVGVTDVVVGVGEGKEVLWRFQPTNLLPNAHGSLVGSKLQVDLVDAAVAEVRTSYGTRRLHGLQRGSTAATLRYPLAAPVAFRVNSVAGVPTKVFRMTVDQPALMRNLGGRIDIGSCVEVSVLALFDDQGTEYLAAWPDAPVENLSANGTLTRVGNQWCGAAAGEAVLRACLGGNCDRVAFVVGPAEPLSIETATTNYTTSPLGCFEPQVALFYGEGPSRREVTTSAAAEWFPRSDQGAILQQVITLSTGMPRFLNGHPCFSFLLPPPPGATLNVTLPARYGGVSVQSQSLTVLVP